MALFNEHSQDLENSSSQDVWASSSSSSSLNDSINSLKDQHNKSHHTEENPENLSSLLSRNIDNHNYQSSYLKQPQSNINNNLNQMNSSSNNDNVNTINNNNNNNNHSRTFSLDSQLSESFDINNNSIEDSNHLLSMNNNSIEEDQQHWNKKKSIRQRIISFFQTLLFSHAGIKLLLLAQLFNSGMIVTARLLEIDSDPPFHPFQVLFVRMLVTYICCVTYMYFNKIPDFLMGPPGYRLLLVARGVIGFFGVFGLYYSVNYLDMSDATVITFLTPTVTAILAWVFLREHLIPLEIVAGFVALCGVVIISRPKFLLGELTHKHEYSDDVPQSMRIKAIFVALLGVLGASSVYVIIRKIGKRVHPLISVSYFSLWACIVSALGLIVSPNLGFKFPRTIFQWTLLISLGVCGFLFQFCLTAGIQRVSAARASAVTYTLIIWTLIWEKVIWKKTPSPLSILGGSLIIGSGITVAAYKWYAQRKLEKQKKLQEQEEEEEGSIIKDDDNDNNIERNHLKRQKLLRKDYQQEQNEGGEEGTGLLMDFDKTEDTFSGLQSKKPKDHSPSSSISSVSSNDDDDDDNFNPLQEYRESFDENDGDNSNNNDSNNNNRSEDVIELTSINESSSTPSS